MLEFIGSIDEVLPLLLVINLAADRRGGRLRRGPPRMVQPAQWIIRPWVREGRKGAEGMGERHPRDKFPVITLALYAVIIDYQEDSSAWSLV